MNEMTAEETLKIINKQWATTKDIMKIACIGEARALKIKKSIQEKLYDDEYVLPRNKIPMEEVIKYFKINIDFLKKIANGWR